MRVLHLKICLAAGLGFACVAAQADTIKVQGNNEKGFELRETSASGVLHPGDEINIRIVGQPSGTATWSLGSVKDRPLREEKPGVYVASYRLRPGDDLDKSHLAASITAPGGRKTNYTFEKNATRTVIPEPPVVTYPGPKDKLADPQVIRGTAQPNSTVRLKITYTSKVLGFLGARGIAAEADVKVDKDGKWETKPLQLASVIGAQGTEYTLTVVAINSNDESSPVATLRFR